MGRVYQCRPKVLLYSTQNIIVNLLYDIKPCLIMGVEACRVYGPTVLFFMEGIM